MELIFLNIEFCPELTSFFLEIVRVKGKERNKILKYKNVEMKPPRSMDLRHFPYLAGGGDIFILSVFLFSKLTRKYYEGG